MDNLSDNEEIRQQQKEFAALRQNALFSLSERVIGKKADGTLPGPKRPEIEKDYGKVRIWSLAESRYITVFPIDGAEMLANGSAVLDKPDEVD